MDFIEKLGILALGTRIKNLGELLMKDMARVYHEQGIEFEPRWFTFFHLILEKKEISVTEIAHDLRQTHPAVVQVVNTLSKKGLVTTRKDKEDNRKRLVSLSSKGRKLAGELETIWKHVNESANELLKDSDPDLMEHISSLEIALQKKSVYDRVTEKLDPVINPEIVECNEKHISFFRELNEEWLAQYLEISDHDRQILNDPHGHFINKSGKIYCMVLNGEVVGTYALQPIKSGEWELSKFTIRKNYRGRKLGEKLLQHAKKEAGEMQCHTLLLFTHHKLTEATSLYRKAGFREIEEHSGMTDPTGRCSLLMKLSINTKK